MSTWDTKDYIVVGSAVLGFSGTIIVQLLQHVFTARRERSKIVEGIRRDLYQQIISHFDKAIESLAVEKRSLIRNAFDELAAIRNIVATHQIDISEDIRRACSTILDEQALADDFDADRHNTGDVGVTINALEQIRDRVVRISRRELRVRRSFKTYLHLAADRFRRTGLYRTVRRWMIQARNRHLLRKQGR
jgi:hypothetical protein